MNSIRRRVASSLPPAVRQRLLDAMEVYAWRKAGCPAPPPHLVKRWIVRGYGRRFGLRALVETGTSQGEMIEATRRRFAELYSIELHPELHAQAAERFAKSPHVHVLQGDSAKILPDVLRRIKEPALFWLDAHYSGGIVSARGETDTPIFQELQSVLRHESPFHVILIDDARLFGSDPAYPSLEEVRDLVQLQRLDWTVAIREDIIRIHPPR